jgi:hypothetical protein
MYPVHVVFVYPVHVVFVYPVHVVFMYPVHVVFMYPVHVIFEGCLSVICMSRGKCGRFLLFVRACVFVCCAADGIYDM